MNEVDAISLTMTAALNLYMVTGGADFGGGVWDLLATGSRAKAQRELIAHAIAPIWEANHVWLILVVVLLFVCFPTAFAAIMTALHIPLLIMLFGVVLRGSAFAFRAYGDLSEAGRRRVGLTFGAASVVTPVMLGVSVAAMATGRLRGDPATGLPRTDFVEAWLHPFPFVVGLFILALSAYLAAVYLLVETEDPGLQRDFRRRALASVIAVTILAFTALLLAEEEAAPVHMGMMRARWSLLLQVLTGAMGLGAFGSLWLGAFRTARVLAIAQVSLIVWGFGLAVYPYLIYPDFPLEAVAAPPNVLRMVLWTLAIGSVLLGPAFWYLFRLFKGSRADEAAAPTDGP